jgi:hypothetical protein
MDRLMLFLMKYIGGFMEWWKKLVPIPSTTVFGKEVKWSVISFPIFIILLMILLLPTGLADMFGWFWYD